MTRQQLLLLTLLVSLCGALVPHSVSVGIARCGHTQTGSSCPGMTVDDDGLRAQKSANAGRQLHSDRVAACRSVVDCHVVATMGTVRPGVKRRLRPVIAKAAGIESLQDVPAMVRIVY